MLVYEVFKESLVSLWQNKGRTFLSVLGIVIGIGSVIAMMAIGNGGQAQITQQIQTLGTNMLTLNLRGSSYSLGASDVAVILANDYQKVFAAVSPEVTSNQTLIAGENVMSVNVTGAKAEYFTVHDKTAQLGSFFTGEDVDSDQKVVVLGETTAEDLFESVNNSLGQNVKIGNGNYRVVAVLKAAGMGQDSAAIIPLTVMQQQLTGNNEYSSISFSLREGGDMENAKSVIGYTMLERHEIADVVDADFSIFSATDLLETLSSVTQTFTLLLAGIAGISLLVGGIGIMNVMLMSVLERTREIGLRKALGAKKRFIVMQFLFEAVLITVAGGVIGLILGALASWGFGKIFDFETVISVMSVVSALGISTIIGLVFGIYPANKAAKLPPIEALRSE